MCFTVFLFHVMGCQHNVSNLNDGCQNKFLYPKEGPVPVDQSATSNGGMW